MTEYQEIFIKSTKVLNQLIEAGEELTNLPFVFDGGIKNDPKTKMNINLNGLYEVAMESNKNPFIILSQEIENIIRLCKNSGFQNSNEVFKAELAIDEAKAMINNVNPMKIIIGLFQNFLIEYNQINDEDKEKIKEYIKILIEKVEDQEK